MTALCTERRITDSASFTKMKMMEICGRSFPYFSSLHLQHEGQRETRGQQSPQGSASSQAHGKYTRLPPPSCAQPGPPLPANPSLNPCCWEETAAKQSIPGPREHCQSSPNPGCAPVPVGRTRSGLQKTADAFSSSRETPQSRSVPRFPGAQKRALCLNSTGEFSSHLLWKEMNIK